MSIDASSPVFLVPPEPPEEWEYGLQMPHDLRGPCVARGTLRVVLATHGRDELGDMAELLLSELATNAYRYSQGQVYVRLAWSRNRLRVSVWDTNPELPDLDDMREFESEADGGRGLLLIKLCADAWGGYLLGGEPYGGGGKFIWFEIS